MVFDFGIRYEDLTLRVDDAVATDRCVGTTVDYSKRTPDEFQSESAVKFSPRAVTHLNVLPANPEYDGPYIDKELLRSVYLERTCQFTRQHCWPAIVLDLSVKQASLEPWLGRVERGFESGEYLRDNIKRDEYGHLINSLAIKKDDILSVCKDGNCLSGKVVLFYTNWYKFVPKTRCLESDFWQGRHPFLLNPYFTVGAIEFLRNHKVRGIGIDCSSIQRRVSGVESGLLPSKVRFVENGREGDESSEIYSLVSAPESDWLPVFECLSIPSSLLHTQKYGTALANIVASPSRKMANGIVLVFLIDASVEHSAVPARILFQEKPNG